MALTPLHLANYCHGGTIECRYLSHSSVNYKGVCTKLHAKEYEKLKKEREKYGARDEKDWPDNCKGYLYLVNAKQGFDIKGSK